MYDIHSPRLPSSGKMEQMLRATLPELSASQVWVNPDYALKTSTWEEVRLALEHMVAAAWNVRSTLPGQASTLL